MKPKPALFDEVAKVWVAPEIPLRLYRYPSGDEVAFTHDTVDPFDWSTCPALPREFKLSTRVETARRVEVAVLKTAAVAKRFVAVALPALSAVAKRFEEVLLVRTSAVPVPFTNESFCVKKFVVVARVRKSDVAVAFVIVAFVMVTFARLVLPVIAMLVAVAFVKLPLVAKRFDEVAF